MEAPLRAASSITCMPERLPHGAVSPRRVTALYRQAARARGDELTGQADAAPWLNSGIARTACATLLLWCVHIGDVRADVLIGPNGERLPGHVIEEKDGVLVFQSDFMGRITVQSDRARVEREPVPAAQDKPATQSSPAASASISAPHWTSEIEAKIGQDRGSLKTPEDTRNVALKLSRKSDDGELTASAKYKYKKTDEQLKDDDWLASVSYDRFLAGDHFLVGRLLGSSELTSNGYDKTGTIAAAYGWRLWEKPGQYLRIGPAAGYLSLERSGEKFDGPAVGLYARVKYPLWGGISFDGEVEQLNASAGNRYGIAELRLKRPLTERLYIALDWLYTASHVEIESGVSSEWRWVIGWSFDSASDNGTSAATPK